LVIVEEETVTVPLIRESIAPPARVEAFAFFMVTPVIERA
jgi:hypothetical protein